MNTKQLTYFTIAAFTPAAFSEQYMTPDQAKQSMFTAADEFVASPLKLSDDLVKSIADKSGVRVADANVNLMKAFSKKKFIGYLVLDKVVGKHEFITYAVSFTPDKQVQNIEILEYKETYGGEVRRSAWREQFFGKTTKDALQLDKDIKNISGATLSSRHITDGVRRLLFTLDLAGVGNERS